MPRTAETRLDSPVQYLKGVGPRRAEALARLGVRTAGDLLFHLPRRYLDASTVDPIRSVRPGLETAVVGVVQSTDVLPTRKGLRIFQAVIRDRTGKLELAWPGQPFLERAIRPGDVLLAIGPVRVFQSLQMQPREFVVLGRGGELRGDAPAGTTEEDPLAAGLVLPVYPATEGLSQRMIRAVLEQNLDALLEAAGPAEVFERAQLDAAGVPPLAEALDAVHRPGSVAEADRGRQRLAYDELFFLQLLHALVRHRTTAERAGVAFRRSDRLVGALYRALPFRLTGAQTRALREIMGDMTSDRRMNRLLQGDVGSGKTVVALFAMLLAVENDQQAALMAPTEILAEQHARTLRALLGELPVSVTLLTSRLGAAERREALGRIGSGEAQLVVGTHALIQDAVTFHRLGLAVIDEQHRFGVRQRMALSDRGDAADTLVMSATPIPRSLALTLYGDLDLSILDERPPGRRPVRTTLRPERARPQVHGFIRRQVAAGRQAYIVYSLVEASAKLELRAATEEHERLAGEVFPDLRVGLLHGQLHGDEKDAVMRRFAAHELDVLVATTVIEVGIDVPNATVMLIENAERFGLSQLHQLRGRVGRGAAESHCIVLHAGDGELADRLKIFESTDDGFAIARADLRLRGMGDFFGARQHGLPEFRFFDPERDEALLARARQDARAVIDRDPEVKLPDHAKFRAALVERYGDRARLYDVG